MKTEFFDTHCHVHELVERLTPVYDKWRSDKQERTVEAVLESAEAAGVTRFLLIGTSLRDSELAVRIAQRFDHVWASIGIHPHEADHHQDQTTKDAFARLATEDKVVAVGECGLDYYYDHSDRGAQAELLRFQLEVAAKHDLPLSFHVRDAYDDFWPIYEVAGKPAGVLHSFTDTVGHMQRAVEYGLCIGVNGIATFTKDATHKEMFATIPPQNLLLETDAPFLTPSPFRGKVCEPKHVVVTAEYLAALRDVTLQEIATITTANARRLFKV